MGNIITTGTKNIKKFLKLQVECYKSNKMKMIGYEYGSLAEFLLKRGNVYKSAKLTPRETEIINGIKKSSDRQFEYKECYYNAAMALTSDIWDNLHYVEGVANSIIPMDHAWLDINGKVVDLTWKENGKDIMGEFPDKYGYIGVIIPKKMVISKMCRDGFAGPMFDWKDQWSLLKDVKWLGQ